MSIEMASVGQVQSATAPVPATPANGDRSTTVAVADQEEAVTVDTIPSSPPAEVLDAIGVASQAYDRLAANEQALHFRIDDATGKVVVEVHDPHGDVLFTVPPSKALEVASGASLD